MLNVLANPRTAREEEPPAGANQGCPEGCRARTIGAADAPEETGVTRRRFIRISGVSSAILSALGLSGIVQAYLSVGPVETAPTRFVLGAPADFPQGSVTLKEGIFVLRDSDGVFAVKAACSHLGCRIQWNAGEAVFDCPCHGSRYDRRGGYLSGPARKPLTPVHLTRNDAGQLVADFATKAGAESRIREG
jgi:nitrite reductase/ring-hydroxylating ferredoxin subunit